MKQYDQEVLDFVKNNKGKLEENWHYINARAKFNLICEKGHIFKSNWDNIKQGCWCPVCAVNNRRVKGDVVAKFIKDKDGKLNENFSFTGCRAKFDVTCAKGHTWKTNFGSLHRGHWCPVCARRAVYVKDIIKFIKNKGGKLDQDFKYVNSRTKFNIECEKGHRWRTSWNRLRNGRWCYRCSLGIDEESIRKFIEDKGGKLDPDWKYITAITKFNVECGKGHHWKTYWNNLKNGHWCPDCAGRIVYEKDILKFIEAKKGKIDRNWKYIDSKVKIDIECEKGHHWGVSWSNLQNGGWCPECAGRITHENNIRMYIEEKGGKLKEDWKYNNWNTFFDVTCEKGHIWKTTWNRLHRHHNWCPECAGNKVREEDVKKFIENKKGKVLSDWKYIYHKQKFLVICENNHEFITCWTYIKAGKWCPYCANTKEQKFRELIENYFKSKFYRIRPKWLKREIGRALELDGYNEKLKIAFEYNGKQHYALTYKNGFSEKKLHDTQTRDLFKIKKCQELGILLIVVPYWIPEKIWLKIIKKDYKRINKDHINVQ